MRPAIINVMDKAARRAGRDLARDFGEVEQLQVSRKGAADFVSAADRKAEQTLHYELMKARPDFGFLGEEGSREEGDGVHRWIVDPLDGTTNYLHGMPHWAVSIALEHKGQIVSAVVFDPAKDEMFFAEKGAGCWLNDQKRLRVSGRHQMVDSVFATGVPWGTKRTLPATIRDLSRLMPECAGVRRWGAASLDLAYVAAGRYEGYWEREMHSWDFAAGMLLVSEAGGMVGPIREGRDPLEDGEILVANPDVYDRFAKIIREV